MSEKVVGIHTLRAGALSWLRYKRQCDIVCVERTAVCEGLHRPDILGVTRRRYQIEIEIKRTLDDFRSNAKKLIFATGWRPRQFYFLVPPSLVEKVLPELPDGDGLMTMSDHWLYGVRCVKVVRGAKTNRESKPLTVRQMLRMVQHQTGTLCSAWATLAKALPEELA
jgi:hypothetical protein